MRLKCAKPWDLCYGPPCAWAPDKERVALFLSRGETKEAFCSPGCSLHSGNNRSVLLILMTHQLSGEERVKIDNDSRQKDKGHVCLQKNRAEVKSGAAGLYICIFLICLSSIMARRDCFDLLPCYSRIKGSKCPGVCLSTLSIAVVLFWSKKKTLKEFFYFIVISLFFFERSKYLLLIFRILWGLGVKSHTSISFLALFHSSLFLTHREQKSFKMWFLSWRFWV